MSRYNPGKQPQSPIQAEIQRNPFLATHVTAPLSVNPKYDRKPIVVFSYDDGDLEELTIALDIHNQFNAPATTYINPRMTLNPQDRPAYWGDRVLTIEQIKTLHDNGWEIGSHTYSHQGCDSYPLTVARTAGETTVTFTGKSNEVPMFDPVRGGRNIECVVSEGDKMEKVIVTVGSKSSSPTDTVTLAAPLKNSYTTAAIIRLSEAELENEITQAREILESWGFDAGNFAYPWGSSNKYARRVISENHTSARATGGPHNGLEFVPNNPYSMGANSLVELTNAQIDAELDLCVANKSLMLSMTHGKDIIITPSKQESLRYAIGQAIAKGITVMTMADALKYHGNAISIGTNTKEDGFFVSSDGQVVTRKSLVQARSTVAGFSVTANTWTKFPYNVEFQLEGDTLNEYNPETSEFVAKVRGTYLINAAMEWGTSVEGNRVKMALYKNGTLNKNLAESLCKSTSRTNMIGSGSLFLEAGDKVEIYVWTENAQLTYTTGTDRTNLTITRLI